MQIDLESSLSDRLEKIKANPQSGPYPLDSKRLFFVFDYRMASGQRKPVEDLR